MTVPEQDEKQACVWATSKDRWDSFLNDPELARAIDSVRQTSPATGSSVESAVAESPVAAARKGDTDESMHSIGARLRAYETPITDEILRQSIR